jgi:hypothetical protein
MTNEEGVALCKRLAEQLLDLEALLSEHIEDNFGDILPHLFMADVERWLEAQVAARQSANAKRLLSYLDSELARGSPALDELLSASFLEHLPIPENDSLGIRTLLGPHLRRHLENMS